MRMDNAADQPAATAVSHLRQLIARLAAPAGAALAEAFSASRPSVRVADAIAQAEARIEILTGWLQLAGVVLFFALYLTSRSAFAGAGMFEPVPAALAAWGLFVVWRLRCAYRGTAGPIFMTAAAAIDVAVLMVAIWSFTLQYDAPAALYLK